MAEIASLLRIAAVCRLHFEWSDFSDPRSSLPNFLETLPLLPVARFGGEEMLSSPSTVRKKETSVVASILLDEKKMVAMIGVVGINGLLVGRDGFSPDLNVLLPDLRGDLRL
ncbi:hypothetical protein ACLOJK_028346 [Asimina triloba]